MAKKKLNRREFVADLGELFRITFLKDFFLERRSIERLAQRLRCVALLRELALEPLDRRLVIVGSGLRGLATVVRRRLLSRRLLGAFCEHCGAN